MCTLSWKPTAGGYVLRFNRDEQRSRKAALPPTHRQRNNVTFLAPTDAERGGTWLLVNAHGLSLCLLNHYPEAPPARTDKMKSRGNLLLDLADCASAAETIKRCASLSLISYPPFQLVAIDLVGGTQIIWDGRSHTTSTLNKKGVMLSSSSFRSRAIVHTRHKIFNRIVGDASSMADDQLEAFHYQRDTDTAASIRMSRPDACTHNISRIEISGNNSASTSDNKYKKNAVANFYYEPQTEISPAEQAINIGLILTSPKPVCESSL